MKRKILKLLKNKVVWAALVGACVGLGAKANPELQAKIVELGVLISETLGEED